MLTLQGNSSPALVCAVTDKGAALCGGLSHTVRVWDLTKADRSTRSLQPSGLLRGHKGAVRAVGQLADGRLYTGCDDGSLRLWHSSTHQPDAELQCGAAVFAVAQLSGLEGSLVTGSSDKLLRLWPLPPPRSSLAPPLTASDARFALEGHAGVISCLLPIPPLSDGRQRCVSGGVCGGMIVWDVSGGAVLRRLGQHGGAVTALAWSGGRLFSTSMDRSLREWDAESGALSRLISHAHAHWLTALLPLSDGTLLTAGADRSLRIWAGAGAADTVPLRELCRPVLAEEEEVVVESPVRRVLDVSSSAEDVREGAPAAGHPAPPADKEPPHASAPPLPLLVAAAVAALGLLVALSRLGRAKPARTAPPVVLHRRR